MSSHVVNVVAFQVEFDIATATPYYVLELMASHVLEVQRMMKELLIDAVFAVVHSGFGEFDIILAVFFLRGPGSGAEVQAVHVGRQVGLLAVRLVAPLALEAALAVASRC